MAHLIRWRHNSGRNVALPVRGGNASVATDYGAG